MDYPLHLIPAFLEMARVLNISRAAEKLGLSQPAVSRQLRALEESLGVSLFLRQSRGLVLTPAGRQLLRDVEPAFDNLRDSLAASRNTASAVEGPLVFGCLAELGQKVFAPILFEFAKLHKGISLDIRLMTEREIAHDVADGQLGLGVATQLPAGEAVRAHRLLSETIVVVTSQTNRHSLETHPDPRFIGFRHRDPLLQAFLRKFEFPNLALPVRISVAVNSHVAMVEAAESLDMFAVLPLRSVRRALDEGRVRLASPRELRNDVFLILPDHEFQEKRYVEVTKFLIRKTRELERAEEGLPIKGSRSQRR